jgi:hypothetical protein
MTDAKSPEGVIINWDFNHLKKEDIQSIGNKLVKELEKAVDEIVASPTVSYQTVFQVYISLELLTIFNNLILIVCFSRCCIWSIGFKTNHR